jgi:hypothetical protein
MFLLKYYFLLALLSLNLIRISRADALKECDHRQLEVFFKKHANSKQALFSHVSFYERPQKYNLEQKKRLCELAVEFMKKEDEMRLKQERRDNIFRKFLAPREQTSYHRDFHTLRY